ncbi:hypothetical protein P7F60_06160 [Rhizobium sp. YJ-22]|uniref:hypothetical protein n=1 Tax=Rhizobium sp. YJ-22 TaxID=3037556 RepID=UPI0024123D9E|nr:hypothetical protein [Rhizobium sp. YJ-22]MDG3575959.1 hypothetical protein [Rhizobium sp. YJ-22]
MYIEPPSADVFFPYIDQANRELGQFEQAAAARLSELMPQRMKLGPAKLNSILVPSDLEDLKDHSKHDPIGALHAVLDRAHFLWDCARGMNALKPGGKTSRAFPGMVVKFCNFCPPKRAGRELTIKVEQLEYHPLLDCSLPVCQGSAYLATSSKVSKTGFSDLPPKD